MAAVVGDVGVNLGSTMPYSKRGCRSTATVTRPDVHRSRRRTDAWWSTFAGWSGSNGLTGMQSVSSSTPSVVVNVVASTLVAGRYVRRVSRTSATGATRKLPPPSSSARANTDGESNRGKQSQSIDPSRPTSASEWQSPIIP